MGERRYQHRAQAGNAVLGHACLGLGPEECGDVRRRQLDEPLVTQRWNEVAARSLTGSGEAARLEHHPPIRFHQGASGRRQPLVVGTRLLCPPGDVDGRVSKGKVEEVAACLAIAPRLVRAAVEYYADFADEVDMDAAVAERVEGDERARWERRQRALG